MAGVQESEFKRLAKESDDKKTNEAYNKYVASMEAKGQKPKTRGEILGK